MRTNEHELRAGAVLALVAAAWMAASHSAWAETTAGDIGADGGVAELTSAWDELAASTDPTVPGSGGSAITDPFVEPASLHRHGLTWRYCPPGADPANKGFPEVTITGFFQADAIWFDQDDASVAVVGDAQDVADFRRSRLAAKGKVAENVDFVMEYDFAFPGRPSFMDVYLDVDEVAPVGRVRVGQMRAPFGLEAMSSIREVAFLERSLFQAMLPFRQVGVNWYGTTADDRMTWSWAGYRFPTDVFADVAGDKGYGTSVRGTTLVYDDSDRARTVHVGASYSYNEPSTNFVRLRTAPEVGFNQLDFRSTEFPVPFFVDTGVLPTESYQLAGLELAGTRGPWWFQSEWLHTTADTLDFGNADFHGGYAQIAYCLTGETHAYNKQAGAYGRIIPHKNAGKCGIGAWELAGRWSYLDLTDNGVVGGEIEDLTAGINWYFNRFTKFQINYIHSTLDRPAGTESETNVFATRAQLDF